MTFACRSAAAAPARPAATSLSVIESAFASCADCWIGGQSRHIAPVTSQARMGDHRPVRLRGVRISGGPVRVGRVHAALEVARERLQRRPIVASGCASARRLHAVRRKSDGIGDAVEALRTPQRPQRGSLDRVGKARR